MAVKRFHSRWACASLLGVAVLCAPLVTSPARADEASDWTALEAVKKQNGDTSHDPQGAITQLQALQNSRTLHPILAAEVAWEVAEIQRTQLKQPEQARQGLDTLLRAVQAQPKPVYPVEVLYLEGEAASLLDQNKAGAAQKLLSDNMALIQAAGASGHPHMEQFASRCLERLCDAQAALRQEGAKPDDTITLLQTSFSQMPNLLDPAHAQSTDWQTGWMYERLMKELSAAGRPEEALSWGKLYFEESAFDQVAIARAVKALSVVWGQQDELAKVRAFAQAQGDAQGIANPLVEVALPKLPLDATKAELEKRQAQRRMGPWSGQVPPLITLHIALGQWREAMRLAQSLVVDDPGDTQGPQQVARVFKAKDGSVARANAFLGYLQGKAPNPVPAFMKEADDEADAKADTLAHATGTGGIVP